MTNAIYAPSNATVIEFGMEPHVDRCYGYLAYSLGLEYWLVPQVSANYHMQYIMNDENVAVVIALLRHVLMMEDDIIPSV